MSQYHAFAIGVDAAGGAEWAEAGDGVRAIDAGMGVCKRRALQGRGGGPAVGVIGMRHTRAMHEQRMSLRMNVYSCNVIHTVARAPGEVSRTWGITL